MYNINNIDSVKLDGCRLDAGAVPAASTINTRISMEFIWHILLTVCMNSECISQDVQWFESEKECREMLTVYIEIPPDGNWTSVEYVCKPKDSVSL